MMLFYCASKPTCGNWFQTNQPEHESHDRARETYQLCVLPVRKILHLNGKFDQHLLLYCGVVKLKLQTAETGQRYFFL